MIIRPYQTDCETGIHEQFKNKLKKVLLVLFMGLGKTFVASNMIRKAVNNKKRVIFIAHWFELIDQATKKFISEGMDVGIVMSGYKEEREKPVQVASIQTLNRRDLPAAHLVIVDEAHRSVSKEYMEVLKHYQESGAYFIGLTATPFRTKKRESFNIFWDSFYRPITVLDAIQQGYVCQSKVYACARIVAAGIGTNKGEFDEKALMKVFDVQDVYINLIDNYNTLIGHSKAIVFCVNKEHSRKTCQALTEAGYRAVHVDSDTPRNDRRDIVRDYKAGLYDVITNVDIFTEGFDCPDIMAVVLNMATTSRAKYFQCAGRGSRILPDGSKRIYKILDMADNTKRFGFVEDDFEISLEAANIESKPGVAPVKDCPKCGYFMPTPTRRCPECGYEMPVIPRKKKTIKEERFIELERQEIAVQPYMNLPKERWKEIPTELLPAFAKKKDFKGGAKWVKYQLAARGGKKLVKIKNYDNPDKYKWEAFLQKAYYEKIPIDAAKWGSPEITATELIFTYRDQLIK